jgi:aminoglycoside phosphotransferase (APT) family kinase protein
MSTTDALITVSRLARSAGSHAVDALIPARRRFPARLEDITPEWLEAALQAACPGARLNGFRVVDEHAGTTSRARIALSYADPGEAGAPPERLFLKLTPADWATRIFVDLTGIGRSELQFYQSLRAELPVRAPEIIGVEQVASGRRFVLLLEDLAVPGVRLATLGDRTSLEDARAVMRALAKLHSRYWESGRFADELAWVPSYESRRRQLPWERFVTGQMIGITLRRFSAEFDDEFARIAAACRDRRDLLERLWSVCDRTLIHGDCHQGNLFYQGGEVGFFDWQLCAHAPGMRDVSYFLCNSFPSELRQAHESELIRLYLDGLGEHGVEAPGFDAAWRQHRLFALYTWLATAFTAAAGSGLQSKEIAMAGLRRATTAATELESVDAMAGRT